MAKSFCGVLMVTQSRILTWQLRLFTHLGRMGFPTTINWNSPFPTLGVFVGIFFTYFNGRLCKQTVKFLIRYRIMWCLSGYALFVYVPLKG